MISFFAFATSCLYTFRQTQQHRRWLRLKLHAFPPPQASMYRTVAAVFAWLTTVRLTNTQKDWLYTVRQDMHRNNPHALLALWAKNLFTEQFLARINWTVFSRGLLQVIWSDGYYSRPTAVQRQCINYHRCIHSTMQAYPIGLSFLSRHANALYTCRAYVIRAGNLEWSCYEISHYILKA